MAIIKPHRADRFVSTSDVEDIDGIVCRHAAKAAATQKTLDETAAMCVISLIL